jgi:hypothetical protein
MQVFEMKVQRKEGGDKNCIENKEKCYLYSYCECVYKYD